MRFYFLKQNHAIEGCRLERLPLVRNGRRYHLVPWEVVRKPRGHGGLGIRDLEKVNDIFGKWLW